MTQFIDPKYPGCFGKSWDPSSVECSGGLDPTYVSPINGTQKRDKCNHYTTCGTRCVNNKVQQPHILPTATLIRPPMAPPAAAALPNSLVYAQPPRLPGSSPVQQYAQPQYPVYPQATPQYYPQIQPYQQPYQPQMQMVPPSAAYYGPPLVPVNHQQPGMQVLGYLSYPEPVDSAPWYVRLFRELFRSSMKGAFHTASNFFDHTTFGRPTHPQLPPGPPHP